MRWLKSIVAVVVLAAGYARAAAPEGRRPQDDRLAAARRFVEQSDRYLHHSKLRRGMKGYGLTVLAGTKIARFDAEVVSVIVGWNPHQDMILMRVSGQDLEKTGIISGMSGSPIFIRDKDGKDKMVGALAYGWSFQKEPICGVQPITQMLVVGGAFEALAAPRKEETVLSGSPGELPGAAAPGADPPADYLETVLNPRKLDFAGFGLPKRLRPEAASDRVPRLVPLATPLMISGGSRRCIEEAERLFGPMGFLPVQSGGVGAAAEAANVRLEPGAAFAVPLATGDMDWAAIGTVTEVIGKRVLAFGHMFFAEGESKLPMGTAYVHTVISSQWTSFKLSSSLAVTGALNRDEYTAVTGMVGRKPSMVPVTVTVTWKDEGRRQVFRYEVCKHRWLTAALMRMMVASSALAWRELPEHHTVHHAVTVEFAKLGAYRAANISSDADVSAALSDAIRPVAALMNNPYGPPADVKSVDVSLTIEKGRTSADLIHFRLDGDQYRPGETVTGKLTFRRFRQARVVVPVQFELPDDLPDGTYSLQVCDAETALSLYAKERPHVFQPRSVPALFDALQKVVLPKADQLYLRLPLPTGGLALARRELPELPESRAKIIAEAGQLDTYEFRQALVRAVPGEYVFNGSTAAPFKVSRQVAEQRLSGGAP